MDPLNSEPSRTSINYFLSCHLDRNRRSFTFNHQAQILRTFCHNGHRWIWRILYLLSINFTWDKLTNLYSNKIIKCLLFVRVITIAKIFSFNWVFRKNRSLSWRISSAYSTGQLCWKELIYRLLTRALIHAVASFSSGNRDMKRLPPNMAVIRDSEVL